MTTERPPTTFEARDPFVKNGMIHVYIGGRYEPRTPTQAWFDQLGLRAWGDPVNCATADKISACIKEAEKEAA